MVAVKSLPYQVGSSNTSMILAALRESVATENFSIPIACAPFIPYRIAYNSCIMTELESDAIVEEEIGAFFPPCPHHITQDLWQSFKNWLKSDMGWPIRSICKPWYDHIRRSQIVCNYCRGEAAIVVDSGSEIGTEEEEDAEVGIVADDEDSAGSGGDAW
ncbi:hypothetical protein FRX31_026767 [Thalictrum thalictroides]|uniref:Uncharacterized protein n=1 Tax=Thalictrum thalictroides TaxID=46969 RepID=A0A7J6VEW1_THATH|nr:hypothetical protein FRX31_026767 [Thalictrum thalictroides]